MKKRRRKQPILGPVLVVTVLALVLPASINYLHGNGGGIGRAGEQAAIVAAALNMPDGGLALLEEQLRSLLYTGEDSPAPPPAASAVPQPAPLPEAEPEPSPQPEPAASDTDMPPQQSQRNPWFRPPKIPDEYAAPIVSESFSAPAEGADIRFGAGYIRNDTKLDDADVLEIAQVEPQLAFTGTQEPQVLIVHTHATESFESYDTDLYDTRNTWRSRENNSNMVAVGAVMAEVLEQNGIGVLHDTTQHDYPSYNGSYERSAETIQAYLQEYPSIQVVLDLHRDAMEREDGSIVKPVAVIDGQKAAQIMIIAGCDNGSMNMPQWRQNLRFAARFQSYMESAYPGLTRPILFCYRKYNQDLTPGSLLLEFGSNANTLSEALYAASLAGQALSEFILDYTFPFTEDEM